jgi:tRNA modification GTPase
MAIYKFLILKSRLKFYIFALMKTYQENIIALATPPGMGSIGVLRLSGNDVIETVNRFFEGKFKEKDLTKVQSHTIHLGFIKEKDRIFDEVLVSVFKNPHSYTGEDVVEISTHGSPYILQQIMQLFLRNGVRQAKPGEFTLRAFLNAKMDLAQAEAVADLVSADSEAAHQLALEQMRGGFSSEIKKLRKKLIHFASLIELELDFAEEDVEFADRKEFYQLVQDLKNILKKLVDSFALGNVLKEGIPVAIAGEPNVGKSTLLNALLNEEKAIVSSIAGTTRDVIEDDIILDGIAFRFIDTAGIREAQDEIEKIGIQKTFEKINEAKVVIFIVDACVYVKDATCHTPEKEEKRIKFEEDLQKWHEKYPDKRFIIVVNKTDLLSENKIFFDREDVPVIGVSAKKKNGLDTLKNQLTAWVEKGKLSSGEIMVSNARHYKALNDALSSILQVEQGLNNQLSTDLLTIDIRAALHSLGEITGEITTDDLLDNIFRNFCIGK